MDYQKYMGASSKDGTATASLNDTPSDKQGGDYQQYMDYQKYMNGGSKGGSQGGNYQQYMDYQKYMGGGSKGGSQAGNYQQYMDYQKYTGGGTGNAGGQASNYQQYMDKYSGNAKPGSDTTNLAASGDYSHYYASYMPAKGVNMSNQTEVAAAMNKKYAGAYTKKYAKNYKAIENAPMNAADCKTLKELKAWRASKMGSIKKWVPEAYQKGPESSINEDFKKNKARIMAAVANATAP